MSEERARFWLISFPISVRSQISSQLVFSGLPDLHSLGFLFFLFISTRSCQMRSSLNMTGLSPSVQQLIATPFSLYHGKLPPYPKSRTLQYIETQAELQKPLGIFMSSTMNSWPSLKTPHSFIGGTKVTGLFLKTSLGLKRLKTVIRTLWSFTVTRQLD